jgi:thiol-disulfide isomerase/thioredoxin
MGRLPSLIAVAGAASLLVAAACDSSSSPTPSSSRSEQVIATGNKPTAATTAPTASASAHPTPHARVGKLCDGDANARGRALPKVTMGHGEAMGAARVDGTMPPPHGRWTWMNFWAAWCGPCKEEMPRLMSWQDKLAKTGAPVRFVFVSLDDDQRQLQDFLERQPQEGLRSTLWLPDGPTRTTFLGGMRMKAAPELPEQALIDPNGHVRCFVEGAVEDGDYAEIAGIIGR